MYTWDVYTAGPFFKPAQIETQNKLKALLEELGIVVCDPREQGPIIVNMKPEDRGPHVFKAILDANVKGVIESKFVLACIDDRDIGTIWELGCAYGYSIANDRTNQGEAPIPPIPSITFSTQGYGNNVMISQSVDGHFESWEKLEKYLRHNAGILRSGTRTTIREHFHNTISRQAAAE